MLRPAGRWGFAAHGRGDEDRVGWDGAVLARLRTDDAKYVEKCPRDPAKVVLSPAALVPDRVDERELPSQDRK